MNPDLQLRYDALIPADQCLVHRMLYYVFNKPILADRDYDMLERRATNDPDTPVDHPIHRPGSDRAADYPDDIIDLVMEIP